MKIPMLELDCASTMFVLGRNEERNYKIQLSAHLRSAIDPIPLQAALVSTVKQYPYFFVRFVSKSGRLFADPVKDIRKITMAQPGSWLQAYREAAACEAQIAYTRNTIILEYSHAVSDGKGGLEVLLHLITEYLSQTGCGEKILKLAPPVPSIREQTANGYQIHAKGFKSGKKRGIAYKMRGKPLGTAIFPKTTSYLLSASEIRAFAKEYQVSVTEFLSALLCIAIWNIQKDSGSGNWPTRIRLSIPVDLRPRFSCRTLRNFSLNVYPEIDPAKEDMELPAVCTKFRRYMEGATAVKQLAGRCTQIEKIGNAGVLKVLPVGLKRKVIQAALDLPFTGSTMTFSNMGTVGLPEELQLYVDSMKLIFSAKPEAPYSCSAITVGDSLRLTLLRTIGEPLLETQLEKLLDDLNINYE